VTQPNSRRGSPEKIGRYEVLEELGKGSMGIVLLAHDPVLGRKVALKYLRPDLHLDEDAHDLLMKRMIQEARAIARVTHSGIVALHDIGEDSQKGTFLIFEHAEGPTLQAVLQRGHLTREGSARLARELGEALLAAHSVSIIHRDIKPGNIILTEKGSRVADFGVARLPDSTLTKAGARLGTPAYSAPESIREGENSPKSDQFSMAACLYEALCGKRAYPGQEAIAVAELIEREHPNPIAEGLGLPSTIDAILLRGMAKKPEDRFKSCKDLGDALSMVLVGSREGQPTLPDENALIQIDRKGRSHAIGVATLWLLVGAILAIGWKRFVISSEADTTPKLVPQVTVVPRPAFLSPTPRRNKR